MRSWKEDDVMLYWGSDNWRCRVCNTRPPNGVEFPQLMLLPSTRPSNLGYLLYQFLQQGVYMMTRKSGFVQYLPIHRTSTSSSSREWEAPLSILNSQTREWLHHMAQALDSTSDIDDDSKIKLINFFSYTAYFLVAGVEQQDQNLHTPCKDAALKQHAPPM